MNKHEIRSKAVLGLPFTRQERAFFLLYGDWADVKAFLKMEALNENNK